MQSNIRKCGGALLAGIVGLALVAGSHHSAAQTSNTKPSGTTKGIVMGGGAPTILKDKPKKPAPKAGNQSGATKSAPPRRSENFKVEIEGVTTQPSTIPK